MNERTENVLPKDCPRCGERMLEIIAAEAQQRNGWYCDTDKLFIKAIGRERYIQTGAKNAESIPQEP